MKNTNDFAELHNFAQFRDHFSNLILKSVFKKKSKLNHWILMTILYVCVCVKGKFKIILEFLKN